MTRRLLGWTTLALAVILGYLATGLVVVASGEMAVVRRFGRVITPAWPPGLHLGAPIGCDTVTRIRTDEVRRVTIGLVATPGPTDEPGAGEFLTGDLNLVRAQATLQYRVADPIAFALRADGVEPLLARVAEASLSRALAHQEIDATLRDQRAAIAVEAAQMIHDRASHLGLGIDVLGLSLTDARPPSEVAADFAAAQAASSEHDRRINEARSYAATTATKVEAQARARVELARARADRLLALSRSRAARFLALQAEVQNARPLTIRRLYLDALREILPKVRRKVVLTPEEPVDLSVFGPE